MDPQELGEQGATNTGNLTEAARSADYSGIAGTSSIICMERHASEYNMRHKYRGKALIFNHEHFDVKTLNSRTGTNVDSDNLSRVLKQLYFEVIVHKDCHYNELSRVVESVAKEDHTDNDCILIAILSHGELGYIHAKDEKYNLDSICSNFTADKCPTLAGKPKLFFIQACQGDRLDPGITMKRGHTEVDGDSTMSYKIPIYADFLIAYSTIPGFYSWRNITRGSWFMQSLCIELSKYGKLLDILTLLTFVLQRVAVDFESCTPKIPEMHQQKQIPCVTTMLTRILRFSDKNPVGTPHIRC